jgi:nicotinate-nucleotide--dimethylbenzimidazole phosphoribosyltransferase
MKMYGNIWPLYPEPMLQMQQQLDGLRKPLGSLGKLERIAVQLVGITGSLEYNTMKKAVAVFAADNGVVDERVTSYPRITNLIAQSIIEGKAGISVLAKHAGADVYVFDVGMMGESVPKICNVRVRDGTANMRKAQAMSYQDAVNAVITGQRAAYRLIDSGYSLIAVGEIGIGNTTPASAILKVLSDGQLEIIVGRGAGLSDEGLELKKRVIAEAIALHKPNKQDMFDVLSKVGSLDIAAMAGFYIGAAERRTPTVIDGFISSVAALVAYNMNPLAKSYMIASHGSAEPGSKTVFKELGLEPMLMMDMRLGEGTGAALAFYVIEAAMKIPNEMGNLSEIL